MNYRIAVNPQCFGDDYRKQKIYGCFKSKIAEISYKTLLQNADFQ